jgi:hypothetical protein
VGIDIDREMLGRFRRRGHQRHSIQRMEAVLSTAAVNLAQTAASQNGRTIEATAADVGQVGEDMMRVAGSKPRIRAAK